MMAGDPNTFDFASLPDLLPVYYKRLFPYELFYRWLSYGNASYFINREFSFTLKDDIYIRYQSFTDQQDMEREIQIKNPWKIDIGAVYSHRPKDRKAVQTTSFQPQEKELVFDIDMTDYDDVRSCCGGADVCEKCWPLMVFAVKIIDRALREDFGFEHILWVFSGRRGIHCWVCDKAARDLSQAGRTAVAEYLNVVKGGENQLKKVKLDSYFIHPSLQAALKIIETGFDDYACEKQEFLSHENRWSKVLALIPSEELRQMVEEGFEQKKDSYSRWSYLKKVADGSVKTNKFRESQKAKEEIMLQLCYPRLDINVSIGLNHLLKSPFCVHPKTGKICVPIDAQNIEKFSPLKVPTLSLLIEEMNKMQSKLPDESTKKTTGYKSSLLADSIALFEQFVVKLEQTCSDKQLEERDKKMEF